MTPYQEFQSAEVQDKFIAYPDNIRPKMLQLRELIFTIAADLNGVGAITETMKWGEPSYIASQTKSGTTIRIDWKKSTPNSYYMYFNCKTTLVANFKVIYGDIFTYGGNRSLILPCNADIPVKELSGCIAMALTYYLAS